MCRLLLSPFPPPPTLPQETYTKLYARCQCATLLRSRIRLLLGDNALPVVRFPLLQQLLLLLPVRFLINHASSHGR